jgi:membrane-bound ClpP family serine protease
MYRQKQLGSISMVSTTIHPPIKMGGLLSDTYKLFLMYQKIKGMPSKAALIAAGIVNALIRFLIVLIIFIILGISYAWLIPFFTAIFLWGIFNYRIKVKCIETKPRFDLTMEGYKGVALTTLNPEGSVKVRGERWHAICDEKIKEGEGIEILGREGMTLRVKRIPNFP